MDLSTILAFISAHAGDVVAGASVLAAGLRWLVPRLKAYADKTATEADDALAEAASIGLALITMLVEALHKTADVVALNPSAPKAPKVEEVVVEDDGSDDEPKEMF